MIDKLSQKLSLFKKPIFLFFINPLLIAFLGIFFTLFFNPLSNFSVLVFPPGKGATIVYPKGELLKGEKIKGEFTAQDNNLGIVSVRFDNFERISHDSVLFSLKEKGQQSWYYQGTYKVNQFQPNKFFPFGFPVIADSSGKTYDFEVESLHGKKGDAIGRSEKLPYFITSYQFPKYEIFASKSRFINYVSDKRVKSTLAYTDSFISALYYFLPLAYYLFITVILDRFCKRKPFLAVFFVLLITCIDIFLIREYRDELLLIISGFWILAFWRRRIEARVLLAVGIGLLFLIPLAVVFRQEIISEKIARWLFVLCILCLLFIPLERKRKPLVVLPEFSL